MKILKNPIVKILVSVVLLVVIFVQQDLGELIGKLTLLNVQYIPLIFLLLIAKYVVSSIRWKNLLIYENSSGITIKYLTFLYFIGSFFNNFMPTSIGGDAYKVIKLGQKLNSKSNAFSATFMERFTGILALVLISSASLISILGSLGVLLFIGFWAAIIIGFFVLRFTSTKIKMLSSIYESLMKYKNHRRVLIWAFATSFLVQFLAIFTQYFIFVAMNVQLPLSYALFLLPLITLAGFFIPSINGVGVQDYLYSTLFLRYLGIAETVSLAASLLYHLTRLLVSLIGGVFYAMGKAD